VHVNRNVPVVLVESSCLKAFPGSCSPTKAETCEPESPQEPPLGAWGTIESAGVLCAAGHGVADESCPWARDELVYASRVGVVGVLVQDFIRALPRRPLTYDEQVARFVEILDQVVREVAVELRHVAPDRLGDGTTLLSRLGREVRLPY